MQADTSKKKWPLLTIIGMVCVVALMAMIIQSLIRCFNPPSEAKVEESAVTAKAEETVAKQEKEKSSSVAGEHSNEHPYVNPAPAPAAPAYNEFCTDSEVIRQRDQSKSGKNKNLDELPPQDR